MDNQNEPIPIKRNRRGKIVHLDQKKKIIYLYIDLKKKEPDIKYLDLVDKLSEESGIGIGTVRKTLSEYKSSGTVSSPINKKRRLSIIEKVDDCNKNEIRKKIHEFWFRRKFPTIQKIIRVVKNDPDLPNISRTSFQRLLSEMQFEYTKRSVLIEKDELVLWRRKYISDIRRYRQEGRTIYYLDETWINSNDCSSKLCADTSVKFQKDEFPRDIPTRSSNPRKKGKQLIIAHIGSSEGFVTGGLLCFETKKNTVDCLDEMNGDKFFEWFCNILPLLKDDAVIVMDNAPYHSVKKEQAPTISCEKDAILEWLKSKGVVITEPYMLKFELLQKVQQIKHQYENYVVDEEAKKFNKIVLRLPPYHYELNPIKLALSIVKTHIKENNTTFSLDDIQKLLNDGIQRVTREMWSDFIINTLKEEDKFWQVDFVSDEMLEKLNMTSLVSLTAAEETTSDLENSE